MASGKGRVELLAAIPTKSHETISFLCNNKMTKNTIRTCSTVSGATDDLRSKFMNCRNALIGDDDDNDFTTAFRFDQSNRAHSNSSDFLIYSYNEIQ